MSLTQTRIKDLDLYQQLEQGDEGYINPEELLFVVDHPSFAKPLKYSYSNFSGANINIQKNRITNLSSRTVSATFSTPFSDAPIGYVSVYRNSALGNDKFRREDVLWDNLQLTPTGFSLRIDTEENLSGIIVEYVYQ